MSATYHTSVSLFYDPLAGRGWLFIDFMIIRDLMARSYTGVMDYDEACFMHLTPGVVHN